MPNQTPRRASGKPRWSSLLGLAVLVGLAPLARAQDVGLWTGLSLEQKLNKSFSVQLNGQLRFSDHLAVTRAYLGEVGLTYRINKHFDVAGYYRFTGRLKWNDAAGWYYRPYHRFYAELSYGDKWHWLKLNYRLRYQNQFKDDAEGLVVDGSYLRNKLELAYRNKSRLTPFVSADVFYRLVGGVDQVRYKAGLDFDVTKHQTLSLSGFTDQPLGTSTATPDWVVAMGYKFRFGGKKKTDDQPIKNKSGETSP